MEAKRFRVFDIENQKMVFKSNNLQECVEKLSPQWETYNKKPIDGGNPYLDFFVDDTVDDIEINWHELMTAWDEGERPEDLSMF